MVRGDSCVDVSSQQRTRDTINILAYEDKERSLSLNNFRLLLWFSLYCLVLPNQGDLSHLLTDCLILVSDFVHQINSPLRWWVTNLRHLCLLQHTRDSGGSWSKLRSQGLEVEPA